MDWEVNHVGQMWEFPKAVALNCRRLHPSRGHLLKSGAFPAVTPRKGAAARGWRPATLLNILQGTGWPKTSTVLRRSVCVQLLSHVQLCVTPRTAAGQASPSFIVSQTLLKLMFIELVTFASFCCDEELNLGGPGWKASD